jgi:hypothetical protein
MQKLASAYERDVLNVRRCIHSVNGRGLVRVSDGGYQDDFLAVKPAFWTSLSSWESQLQLDGQQEYTGEKQSRERDS